MKKISKIALSLLAVATVTSLASCGKQSKSDSTKASQDTTKAKTILVGTSLAPKPFTYKEGDTIKGYDIDLLRAIDKKLPDYKFKFEVTEFTSILTDLDTGRVQIGANNFGYTDERAQKYTFSKPVVKNPLVLVVKKGSGIKGFADLAGKTTTTGAGTNYTAVLEKYNAAHGNKIKINYTEADWAKRLLEVEDGAVDFTLTDDLIAADVVKNQKLDKVDVVQITDDSINPNSYFLFAKDADKKLVSQVNAQITAFKKDGTLEKISKEYLGKYNAPDDK
ncbi:transporter substrate-binding domain-containing protein [Lactococcus insecticola]|uniref:Amino acid ABC transporter substrate-binding protein n=1 Tax=Pseudolactococcus insecticola TaxID=2709158 RepID=A0A6A0BA45_9LACT|nr:transporter substrate-binding domain-containing protein [Lactococcus insecticola]GFH41234.1 amino acid ABC transporter substrate-binding protein [Lactococcus insecticola]